MGRQKITNVDNLRDLTKPPDLSGAIRAAVADMEWLTLTDRALTALAIRQATEIETAVEQAAELRALAQDLTGDDNALKRLVALEAAYNAAKVVSQLGPQLQAVLKDLGGTPAARRALQENKQVGGRLAHLRAAVREHDS